MPAPQEKPTAAPNTCYEDRVMKTKYKRHLDGRNAVSALCGSHTSAQKYTAEQWLRFPANERCPKCETVYNMGVSATVQRRARKSA
jgi:hypothetical protein